MTLRTLATSSLALTLATGAARAEVAAEAVLATYADIAEAAYTDSLATAHALSRAIDALLATPSGDTLTSARRAWVAARVPYQQTEVFRFGNPIVDDWEGKVNAWPLDEGLIDYTDASHGGATDENPLSYDFPRLLCDKGAAAWHGIHAGQRRGSDRGKPGASPPRRSVIAAVFSSVLNGYPGSGPG